MAVEIWEYSLPLNLPWVFQQPDAQAAAAPRCCSSWHLSVHRAPICPVLRFSGPSPSVNWKYIRSVTVSGLTHRCFTIDCSTALWSCWTSSRIMSLPAVRDPDKDPSAQPFYSGCQADTHRHEALRLWQERATFSSIVQASDPAFRALFWILLWQHSRESLSSSLLSESSLPLPVKK